MKTAVSCEKSVCGGCRNYGGDMYAMITIVYFPYFDFLDIYVL